jgi:hypothetical protein
VGRKRDHKAEYKRRLERAFAQGLSRAQARGHARVGETPMRGSFKQDRDRFEAALKTYRHTKSQRKAAEAVGVSTERFRRFLRETVEVSGRGRTLQVKDPRPRQMTVISEGHAETRTLRDFDNASLNGRHLQAFGAFVRSNDIELLKPFEGKSVIDVKGKSFPLETDPNTLHRLANAGSEVFHEIYRLII